MTVAWSSSQKLLLALMDAYPGIAEHGSALSFPAGKERVDAELEILRSLGVVHDALRLRVGSNGEPELADEIDADVVCVASEEEALAQATALFDEPLGSSGPLFSTRIFHPEDGRNLLVVRASHVVIDAQSRHVFLRDRHRLTSGVAVARPPQWDAMAAFERTVARPAPSLDALPELPSPFASDPRGGVHPGMVLGPVSVREAPLSFKATNRAIFLYAVAFATALSRIGCGPAIPVALPQSRRRPIRAANAIGNFVDHATVTLHIDDEMEATCASNWENYQRRMKDFVPLADAYRLQSLDPLADPARLTQFLVSHQPGTRWAPPFLLSLPGEDTSLALGEAERFEPVFPRVVPMERQDTSLMCGVWHHELRWRVGVRADVLTDDLHRELERELAAVIDSLIERGVR